MQVSVLFPQATPSVTTYTTPMLGGQGLHGQPWHQPVLQAHGPCACLCCGVKGQELVAGLGTLLSYLGWAASVFVSHSHGWSKFSEIVDSDGFSSLMVSLEALTPSSVFCDITPPMVMFWTWLHMVPAAVSSFLCLTKLFQFHILTFY